jgi:hypothetical protein
MAMHSVFVRDTAGGGTQVDDCKGGPDLNPALVTVKREMNRSLSVWSDDLRSPVVRFGGTTPRSLIRRLASEKVSRADV